MSESTLPAHVTPERPTPQLDIVRYDEQLYPDHLAPAVLEALAERSSYEQKAADDLYAGLGGRAITDVLAGEAKYDTMISRRLDRVQRSLRGYDARTQQRIDVLLANDISQAPDDLLEAKQTFEQLHQPTTWTDYLAHADHKNVLQFIEWHHAMLKNQQGMGLPDYMQLQQAYAQYASGLRRQVAVEGSDGLDAALLERFQSLGRIRLVVGNAFDPRLHFHDGYVLDDHSVVISPRVSRPLPEAVGHEITHLIGGFEFEERKDNAVIDAEDQSVMGEAVPEMITQVVLYGADVRTRGTYGEFRDIGHSCMSLGGVSLRELSHRYAGARRVENLQRLVVDHVIFQDALTYFRTHYHPGTTQAVGRAAQATVTYLSRRYAPQGPAPSYN